MVPSPGVEIEDESKDCCSVGLLVAVGGTAIGRLAQFQAPPLDLSKYAPYGPNLGDGDYVDRPTVYECAELTVREDCPRQDFHLTMDSHDSKIYPGIVKDHPGVITPYRRNLRYMSPTSTCPVSVAILRFARQHGFWRDADHSRQHDRRAPGAVDDRNLHQLLAQRRSRQRARPGVRHPLSLVRPIIEWRFCPSCPKEATSCSTKDPNVA